MSSGHDADASRPPQSRPTALRPARFCPQPGSLHGQVFASAGGPVVAEIRPDAVRNNVQVIRGRLQSGVAIYAAVKADAYGHGLPHVLGALYEAGVEAVAVAQLEEALGCRSLGWCGPILCFGPPWEPDATAADRRTRAGAAVAGRVRCTVTDLDEVRLLARAARNLGRVAEVEVQLETGMGRCGLLLDEASQLLPLCLREPAIRVTGLYTHFATADEEDLGFARQQLGCFTAWTDRLPTFAPTRPRRHAANSAAIFRLPEAHLDAVRPGLAVYGYWAGPPGERPVGLQPAMRVVSRVEAVRRLPTGHAIGYGRTFTTSRDSRIGVVPVGYADGFRRLLSNGAVMTLPAIREQPRRHVPVVGRVSMDQVSVDLTDAGDVRGGDPVVIVDDDVEAPNSVEHVAERLETIPYEVTTLLGSRIRRIAT